jgi:hypothetical protein
MSITGPLSDALFSSVANHCSQLVKSVALPPTHLQVRSEHPRLSQRLSPAAAHRSNGNDPYFAEQFFLSSHVVLTAYTFGSLSTTQTGPFYRSLRAPIIFSAQRTMAKLRRGAERMGFYISMC